MFQAVNLGLTLKEDLKCGYNQDLVRSGAMEDIHSTRFFRNSSDLFLHGFVEKRTGSCSSLPVLMAAVGRRCGYPLYLVACKGHLFCRWDDGTERFNIETACPGVDSKPDVYYKQWPHPSSESEIRTEGYLLNLTPKQELAVFAQLRASCLQENHRLAESLEAYSLALEGFPLSTHLKAYIDNIHRRNSK
jgi:regulator of sirC expression with transglutaminase-like and TPR domain